jgi:MrfA Zn-binding domain
VAVHRLRAVTCLYGFTRLEPAPTMSEALLDDVQLAVEGAPLAENADWLPAMEQRGEGIFLKIAPSAIRGWLARDEVGARGDQLERGILRYRDRYGVEVERPGLPYVLLHSMAHALMEQIALECGYPLSSLKERVYAFAVPRPDIPDRFGLLIYTASAGAQGTLGGLVEIANRIPEILNSALDRMRLCSNDPICADHDPSVAGDERSLLGAACHACLLVPETSCEARNVYLDRALLIETVAQAEVALV